MSHAGKNNAGTDSDEMQPDRDIQSYPGTARRGQLASMRIPLSIVLLSAGFAGMGPLPAVAQVVGEAPQATAPSPDAIKQREQELEATRAQQKNAAELQEKLKADIAAIGQDRSKLNQQLIDIAAQVRGVETKIGDAEARLRPLDSPGAADPRIARFAPLRDRRGAGRSATRGTPHAAGAAGSARRTRCNRFVPPCCSGPWCPNCAHAPNNWRAISANWSRLRKSIASERDQLAVDRDKLKDDQTRLAALVDERQRQQNSIEKDMEAENARAITLSRQVDSLQGLIAKMEQDSKSAAKAAATASLQGSPAAINGKPNLEALKDPTRMSPAIAFASAKGLFAMPVNGVKICDFGGSDGAGGVEKGISLATRAGAQVTTPCDGWVVYAGPFRSYGQLLILNAGGGYHVLIAGMERISVNIGQFVLTGEPVATMGTTSRVASILAANASRPVLYIEFRKDGTPIDPGPWWAANEGEKVRG